MNSYLFRPDNFEVKMLCKYSFSFLVNANVYREAIYISVPITNCAMYIIQLDSDPELFI